MKNILNIIAVVVLVVLGFATLIYTGYYVNILLKSEKVTTDPIPQPSTIIPTPKTTPNTNTNNQTNDFYFEDTIIAISKNKPYIAIAGTVTRRGKNQAYSQNTRVSYFNSQWKRFTDYNTNSDNKIYNNSLIQTWNHKIDESRVLKESIIANLNLGEDNVNINTGELQNEISMRSLSGYTKFMSKGNGFLTINNQNIPAHIIYTKIYSLNTSEIQFYTTPLGLETNWLVFFDTNQEMYHVDKTYVENSTELYKTHEIGVYENQKGGIIKTFAVKVEKSNENPPKKYTFSLENPINSKITINTLNAINKNPSNSSTWYMSIVEGSVLKETGETVNGIGLVEYIKD